MIHRGEGRGQNISIWTHAVVLASPFTLILLIGGSFSHRERLVRGGGGIILSKHDYFILFYLTQ